MKPKLLLKFAIFTFVAVFLVLVLNVNFNAKSSDLSDIALANVEALASGESGQCGCYGPKSGCLNNLVWCSCENDKCCKDLQGCD
jgi:hypothetical protein